MYDRALRITKMVAFGMIIFPEPITTVIGLSILLSTGVLSRKFNGKRLKTQNPL
jgi:hypothetical protein